MGICIAYRGKLREPGLVKELVSDLKAKADAVGWPSKTMTELVRERLVGCSGLEGITLYPHRACEPLHFHFDREGVFVNHAYYVLLQDPEKAAMFRQAIAESNALAEKVNSALDRKAGRKGARGARKKSGISVGVAEMPEGQGGDKEARKFFEDGMRYNWTKTQFAGAKVHAAVCAVLRHVKQRYAAKLEITDDSGYFVDGDYEKLEAQLAEVDYLLSITSQAIETAATSRAPMTLDAFISKINAELAGAHRKLH